MARASRLRAIEAPRRDETRPQFPASRFERRRSRRARRRCPRRWPAPREDSPGCCPPRGGLRVPLGLRDQLRTKQSGPRCRFPRKSRTVPLPGSFRARTKSMEALRRTVRGPTQRSFDCSRIVVPRRLDIHLDERHVQRRRHARLLQRIGLRRGDALRQRRHRRPSLGLEAASAEVRGDRLGDHLGRLIGLRETRTTTASRARRESPTRLFSRAPFSTCT